MRIVTKLSRRRFGQGVALAVAVFAGPGRVVAHDGAHEHEVRISSFAFEPADLSVVAGDTVRWTNADIASHTATSETGNWDTESIDRGAAARVTFNKPAVHRYFCAFHPHMKGLVRVVPRG